ncbi:hypothetical protein V1517DRAFT_369681 [Lipomyces orientalis]|uniref:Uncharacterized protein n=1 Tax=Lipomyces orientalis TaxID=1233043 RepID=A0ACC3TFJ1_9ASCO
MHQIDNVGFALFSRILGIAAKSMYVCKEIFDLVYDCCPKVPFIFGAYSFTYITLRPRIHALFGQAELASRILEYRPRGRIFQTKTEIALTLSVDVWPIVIMNNSPDKRYNKQNLFLFGSIPWPKYATGIFSFLSQLLEAIKELSETGITVFIAAEVTSQLWRN